MFTQAGAGLSGFPDVQFQILVDLGFVVVVAVSDQSFACLMGYD